MEHIPVVEALAQGSGLRLQKLTALEVAAACAAPHLHRIFVSALLPFPEPILVQDSACVFGLDADGGREELKIESQRPRIHLHGIYETFLSETVGGWLPKSDSAIPIPRLTQHPERKGGIVSPPFFSFTPWRPPLRTFHKGVFKAHIGCSAANDDRLHQTTLDC